MDCNLGVSRVATSSTDAFAYGDLCHWGRFGDGHQCRNSGTTHSLSPMDIPDHALFMLAINSPSDWCNIQNNYRWHGINGINNPCPNGFRLPTDSEWEAERRSWRTNDAYGAFNSPLKLTLGGDREYTFGALVNVGSSGNY
jgi:hypothetical protein